MALLALILLLVALAVLGGFGWVARTSRNEYEQALAGATRGLGIVAGTAAAGTAWGFGNDTLGRSSGLAPAVFGLVVLLFAIAAETIVRPAPAGARRRASLTPRRLTDYMPTPLVLAAAVASALTVAVLTFTTLTAGSDDLGRSGRVFGCSAGGISASDGPYPGSFYSVPIGAAVILIGILTGVASLRVVRRPRGYASGDDGDGMVRRRSLRVVVGAALLALCATLGGVAAVSAHALRGVSACAPSWAAPVGDGLGVIAGAAAVGALWGMWSMVRES